MDTETTRRTVLMGKSQSTSETSSGFKSWKAALSFNKRKGGSGSCARARGREDWQKARECGPTPETDYQRPDHLCRNARASSTPRQNGLVNFITASVLFVVSH